MPADSRETEWMSLQMDRCTQSSKTYHFSLPFPFGINPFVQFPRLYLPVCSSLDWKGDCWMSIDDSEEQIAMKKKKFSSWLACELDGCDKEFFLFFLLRWFFGEIVPRKSFLRESLSKSENMILLLSFLLVSRGLSLSGRAYSTNLSWETIALSLHLIRCCYWFIHSSPYSNVKMRAYEVTKKKNKLFWTTAAPFSITDSTHDKDCWP